MNLLQAWSYFDIFRNQNEVFVVSGDLAVLENDVDIIHAGTLQNSPRNHV